MTGCGDDGSGDSGRRSAPLTDITAAEYQDLCDRYEGSIELGTYDECTGALDCEMCLGELLGGGEDYERECGYNIGTPEDYIRSGCTWTLGQIQDCLDDRAALQARLSCDRPIQEGEDVTCLSPFLDACMPGF